MSRNKKFALLMLLLVVTEWFCVRGQRAVGPGLSLSGCTVCS